MDNEVIKRLIEYALSARKNSYAPYSRFRVGAALLASDGRIFTGVNVENASYPAGLCAERAAVAKAVSEGAPDFLAIAVAGGYEDDVPGGFCAPCGICRQVLTEHCSGDFPVILARTTDDFRTYKLSDLLPLAFDLVSGAFK